MQKQTKAGAPDAKGAAGTSAQPSKPERRSGRPKGSGGPAGQVRRQELIAEALDCRRHGYSYRQIAEATGVSIRTAYERVQKGLATIPAEAVQGLLKLARDQLDEVMQRLMPMLDDDPLAVVDSILKVQGRVLHLHGFGSGGRGIGDEGEGESEVAVIARIKANAPCCAPMGLDRPTRSSDARQGASTLPLRAEGAPAASSLGAEREGDGAAGIFLQPERRTENGSHRRHRACEFPGHPRPRMGRGVD